jgi:hypothetical protein
MRCPFSFVRYYEPFNTRTSPLLIVELKL